MRGRKSPEQTKIIGKMFVADILKEYNETGKVRTLCKIREKYGIFYRVGSNFIINLIKGLDINDEKSVEKVVAKIHDENKRMARVYHTGKKEEQGDDISTGLVSATSRKVRVPGVRRHNKISNVFANNPVGVGMSVLDKLRFTPEGVILYSLIHGPVKFCGVKDNKIICEWKRNDSDDKMTRLVFQSDMKFITGQNALPVLFPNESARDWSDYSPVKVGAAPEIRMVCVKRDNDKGKWVGAWQVAEGIGGYSYVVRETEVVSEIKDTSKLVASEHCECYKNVDVLTLAEYETMMMSQVLGE